MLNAFMIFVICDCCVRIYSAFIFLLHQYDSFLELIQNNEDDLIAFINETKLVSYLE